KAIHQPRVWRDNDGYTSSSSSQALPTTRVMLHFQDNTCGVPQQICAPGRHMPCPFTSQVCRLGQPTMATARSWRVARRSISAACQRRILQPVLLVMAPLPKALVRFLGLGDLLTLISNVASNNGLRDITEP